MDDEKLVEAGRAIYMAALAGRRGFRPDQTGVDDDIWPEIFTAIGHASLTAIRAAGYVISPPGSDQARLLEALAVAREEIDRIAATEIEHLSPLVADDVLAGIVRDAKTALARIDALQPGGRDE